MPQTSNQKTPSLNIRSMADANAEDLMLFAPHNGDCYGITAAEISLGANEALAFWRRMEDVADGQMTSSAYDGIWMGVHTLSDENDRTFPTWDDNGAVVYDSRVVFQATEKRVGEVRVELTVERKVFEDFLVEHGLISEADCRSERTVSAPAP